MVRASLEERYWAKVDRRGDDDCWLWTGALAQRTGYGIISLNHRCLLAHRLAWQWAHGEIPDGLTIDHLCRVKRCQNPRHLEPVTRAENSSRVQMRDPTRATCDHGHPWSEANTYWYANGQRKCRACRRASVARAKTTKSAPAAR